MSTTNHPSYGRGMTPAQSDANTRMARALRIDAARRRVAALERAPVRSLVARELREARADLLERER